jgi:hypothetical protein
MHTSREPVRLALRQLWSDHVVWTRLYIIAAVGGTPDATAAADRLLSNQDQIGNAVKPYYGNDAGSQLTKLLKDHIMIAVDLVEDAKSGNNDKFAKDDKRWDDNVRDIAKFLSGANPTNWSESDVYDLLNQHLQLTKGEVVARIKQDWTADVKAFDDIYAEIMVVADTLYDGLAAQFPDKFDTNSQKQAVGVA